MNHEELANRLEHRLERIEDKLDRNLEVVALNRTGVAKNTTDVSWIKGYVKISITSLLGLASGVILILIKLFVKTN